MAMKTRICLLRLVFASLSGVLLSGCLLKTATVPARHFVLAPIPPDESGSAPKEHASVEIGFVKMPAYVLRDSMAVRNGANEIEYLENALWAERLDQSFQRALAADMYRSRSATNHFPESERKWQRLRILVTVDQFDVDTNGRGTLVAQWRIAASDGNEPVTSGHTSLARTGGSPRGYPVAIAKTMSELTAEFSHELTRSLSGSPGTATVSP
jgi:uncharacterized lipoprotein YmbA